MLKTEAGVRLIRVDELSASHKLITTHFRLSTLRPAQPRVLANERLARSAYDVEVKASKKDPTAMRLAEAGH